METLIDSLRRQAELRPRAGAFRFFGDGERETDSLDYGTLDRDARRVAYRLRELNAQGQRVLLLLPQDLRFIVGFFGCLYAGAVAVPVLTTGLRRSLSTLRAIVANAKPIVALTTRDVRVRLEPEMAADCPGLAWQCIEDIGDASFDGSSTSGAEDVALLQYTSGSTGAPKGVMVKHANLLHNIESIGRAFTLSEAGVIGGGWLPMYHDMGLIGLVLAPVHFGVPIFLMPPSAFLQKPVRWLKLISDHGVRVSGAPNFAYDLCVDRFNPEVVSSLDLSCWDIAFIGAEPVRWSTLERFRATFQPHGFRGRSLYPCYGMAEATLFVTGEAARSGVVTRDIDAESLRNRKIDAATGDDESVRLVACGRPWHGTRIAIVDPVTRLSVRSDEIGEIWISGSGVAAGYFERQEETDATFHARLASTGEGPFLRTGDLGFVHESALYIAGRLKDVIIIRGRNYYPQDLEATAEQSSDALQRGAGTAFAIDVAGKEGLVLVHEIKRTYLGADYHTVALDVQEAIVREHGVGVYAILLLGPGGISKTSSGKMRRAACRELFLRNELQILYRFATAGELALEAQ